MTLQKFVFYFIIFTIFGASNEYEFGFNPHEIVRRAQEAPLTLNLDSRAVDASLQFTLPPAMENYGAEELIENVNTLAKQADNLLSTLQSLQKHFDNKNGPEIKDIQDMTAKVSMYEKDLTVIKGLIGEINQMMDGNANDVTYIGNELTCMANSKCNTGPTTPPPANQYDCSLSTTTQTVTKEGDKGSWTITAPTEFNCSLIIQSQKGLWINMNVSAGGDGEVIVESGVSGLSLGNVSNGQISINDIADTQILITISGAVTLNINFNAVGVCTVTDCGNGDCSVDPTNKPVCSCRGCWQPDATTGACTVKRDPCKTHGRMCGDPSYCVPFENSTTCSYYCNCPDNPQGCQPQWCGDPSACDGTRLSHKSMWKREDEMMLNEFDPYEFVQQAQVSGGNSLNFTIPDSVEVKDPYTLLQSATSLADAANNLMTQLQGYLEQFNNTASAPEWSTIQQFINRLETANATLGPLYDRLETLQDISKTVDTSLADVKDTLVCYETSDCHKAPSTTTPAPPPIFTCTTPQVKSVSVAGDSGSFQFPFIYQFNNCELQIKSTQKYGLWINIKISNLFSKTNDSTITIQDSRGNKTYTVTPTSTTLSFFNLTSDVIVITVNGQLRFDLDFTAIDPCAGYDCGYGSCVAVQPLNKVSCICQGCYNADGNGRCTVEKPKACSTNKKYFCTSVPGGICHDRISDCTYYCICPGVNPSCKIRKTCDEDDHTCSASYYRKTFLTQWFNFF